DAAICVAPAFERTCHEWLSLRALPEILPSSCFWPFLECEFVDFAGRIEGKGVALNKPTGKQLGEAEVLSHVRSSAFLSLQQLTHLIALSRREAMQSYPKQQIV